MARYDYILWDWNGTLVDDLDANIAIINNLLCQRGLPMLTKEHYRHIFKFPIIDFYRDAGFNVYGQDYEKLVSDYQVAYAAQKNNIDLMPNAEAVLRRINGTSIKQIILSASSYKAIEQQMSNYHIYPYFDAIVSQTNVYACGKIDLARRWISISRADPNRVLVIGDTLHDYEVAVAMNFDCLLISNGHQDLYYMRSEYSCKCLSDICQVLDYIG